MSRLIEAEPGLDLKPEISRPLFSHEPQRETAFQPRAQSMVIEPPAEEIERNEKPREVEEGLKPEEKIVRPAIIRSMLRLTMRPVIQSSLELPIQAVIQAVFFKERTSFLKLQPQPELAVVRQRQQFQRERQTLQLWLSAEQGKEKEKVLEQVAARSAIEPTTKLVIIEKSSKAGKQVMAEPLLPAIQTRPESIFIQPAEALIIISEAPIAKVKQEPEELLIAESVPVVFGWQNPLFRVRPRKERQLADFQKQESLIPFVFRENGVWSIKAFEQREDMFLSNLFLHSLKKPVQFPVLASQVIFDSQWLEPEMIIPFPNTKIIKADEYPEELTIEAEFLELVEKLLVYKPEDDYQDLLPFYLYSNEEKCKKTFSEFSFYPAELYD